MSSQSPLRVLYIHGRVSSSKTAKYQHLSTHFQTHCVEYTPEQANNYESVVKQQARAIKEFKPDVVIGSSYGGSVAVSLVQRAYSALADTEHNEKAGRVLIAGEQNEALNDENAELEGWVGPTILLAQAYVKYFGKTKEERDQNVWWPAEVPAKLVHGTNDDVIPVEDSRILAKNLKSKTPLKIDTRAFEFVETVEVEGDGHMLESLAQGDRLINAVKDVAERWDHARNLLPRPR